MHYKTKCYILSADCSFELAKNKQMEVFSVGEKLNMHEEVVAEPVEEMAAPALDTGEEPVAQNKAKGDKAGAWIKSLFSTKKRKIIAVVLLVVIVLGGAAAGVFSYFSPSSTAERYCKASYCDARTFFSMTAYDAQSALCIPTMGDEEAFLRPKAMLWKRISLPGTITIKP